MLPDALDQVPAPGNQPRLRPAEQLVAAESHEIGPGGEHVAHHGLLGQTVLREVDQAARAEIDDEGQAVFVAIPASSASSTAAVKPVIR